METRKILTIVVLALDLVRCASGSAVTPDPLRTAFTYQGRLLDANYPANGEYDFQFKLFDSLAGSQVGSDVNVPDVEVIDGYFTVELDFNDVFDGNERWLEIGVGAPPAEPPVSCEVDGDCEVDQICEEGICVDLEVTYITLSPRQELTATPHAIYAKIAGRDGDWMISGDDMYSIPTGNVGIGTTGPNAKLTINDNIAGVGPGVPGIMIGNDGTSAIWLGTDSDNMGEIGWLDGEGGYLRILSDSYIHFGVGPYTSQPDVIFTASGDVGIGTSSPSHKLNVIGDANITGSLYAGTGSTVLFVDDTTDRVGIGTTSPGEELEIYKDQDDWTELRLNNPNGGTNAGSGISFNEGGGYRAYISVANSGNNVALTNGLAIQTYHCPIAIRTVGDYPVSILPYEGNVGIGTTEPSEKLTVVGDANITGNLYAGSGSTVLFVDDATDRVGIGTTSPSTKLHIAGSQPALRLETSATFQSAIEFVASGDPKWAILTDTGGFSQNNLSFRDMAAGVTRLFIDPTGNVGIGLTDPSEDLDVAGTARLRGISSEGGTWTIICDGTGKLFKLVSSKRYKRNIENLQVNRDAVLQLRPVSFEYKSSGQRGIGLIAEEVEEHLPDLVIYDNQSRPDAVKYDKVSLYLLDIVKELKAENDSLKQRLEDLESAVRQLAKAKEIGL